jgi:predicted ArsR family transcriptional regulator
MSVPRQNTRWVAGTRGQIINMLRRASQTVEELAQALGLTDNAVRAHLATLERDGLIQASGRRRGVSKPAALYGLTAAAEDLFAKAYIPVLRELVEELNARRPPEEVEAVISATGSRLAAQWPRPQGALQERLEAVVAVLNALGGLEELEQRQDTYVIHGYSCPLAAAVPGHPAFCRLTRALLMELVGSHVEEQCVRNEKPSCHFVVSTTGTL